MKRFEFMIRGAITALAAFGLLAWCPAVSAQSVVLTVNPNSATANGVQLCASPPVLGMDPSGGLTVTCTPANGGGTTLSAPACTVPSVTVTIPSGATTIASATIGAVCSGNPIPTYQWTNTDGATGFTNLTLASATGGPLAAGPYHFTVAATNSQGSTSASGILTVNPPPAGGSGCATTPINAVFTGSMGGDRSGIVVGGFASYALPQFAAANQSYQNFTAAESTTSGTIHIEYAVSPCVGDFTAMPAVCKTFGTSASGITLNVFESNAASTVCVMQPNTQYFLNVRTVNIDGTNSCTTGTCYMYVQYHLFTY
jgi:hypothetical protein